MVALLRVMARAIARRIGVSPRSALAPAHRSRAAHPPAERDRAVPIPAIAREIDAVLGSEPACDRRAADAPADACCDGDGFDGAGFGGMGSGGATAGLSA